jgi:hypothetical protein
MVGGYRSGRRCDAMLPYPKLMAVIIDKFAHLLYSDIATQRLRFQPGWDDEQ